MAVTVPNMSGHSQNQLTRSLERILEEAHYSGELKLSGRKLKEFPKVGGKYNLSDTVIADLSKNRFGELPAEVTDYYSLERLDLYYNVIRTIPDTVILLQALVHLDLSRNQLSVLPPSICQLPLQVLLVSNNKLVSLPEEVGRVKTLTELDASCNEITHLPRQIGDLEALKSLSLRRNLLVELPVELTYLRLVRLDISLNRISTLPVELRLMTTLVILNLSHNPLTLPPAHLCTRGRVHIFKFLEIQALKEEKKKGVLSEELRRSNRKACHLADMRHANGITTESRQKRYMVDSGYVTGDDKRWSQEIRSMSDDLHRLALHSNEGGKGNGLAQDRGKSRNAWPKSESTPIAIKGVEPSNGSCSGASTPSTISPGDSMNLEEELMRSLKQQQEYDKKKLERLRADHDVEEKKIIANDKHVSPRFATNNINRACSNGPAFSPTCEVVANNLLQDEKKPVEHIQTYREYKEALKQQQRAQEGSIYRPRQSSSSDSSTTPTNSGVFKFDSSPYSRTNSANGSSNHSTVSRTSSVSSSGSGSTSSNTLVNGSDAPDYGNNGSVGYRPRSSPVKSVSYSKSSPTIIPTTAVSSPKLVTTSMKYVNSVPSSSTGSVNNKIVNNSGSANVKSRTGKSSLWSREVSPVKLNFTMRREYEKAREEAELISQLKNHIETRLKMSLPDDVSSALMDGVVLCHLANHVRPRSVASIHVPSPAMPKLSLAKCRRNVDNFLEACRRIGVEEEYLCPSDEIVLEFSAGPVLNTVERLLLKSSPKRTLALLDYISARTRDNVVSFVCLAFFVGTLLLLYFFPPPD